MKRVFILLLSVIMILSAGCAKGKEEIDPSKKAESIIESIDEELEEKYIEASVSESVDELMLSINPLYDEIKENDASFKGYYRYKNSFEIIEIFFNDISFFPEWEGEKPSREVFLVFELIYKMPHIRHNTLIYLPEYIKGDNCKYKKVSATDYVSSKNRLEKVYLIFDVNKNDIMQKDVYLEYDPHKNSLDGDDFRAEKKPIYFQEYINLD